MFIVQWAVKGTEDWLFLARYRDKGRAAERVAKLRMSTLSKSFHYRVVEAVAPEGSEVTGTSITGVWIDESV